MKMNRGSLWATMVISIGVMLFACEKESGHQNAEPEAGFLASDTIGFAPFTVIFADQSNNNPTTWQWKFGDGKTSTQQHPRHIYQTPGTYTVELTVLNKFGSHTLVKTNHVTVDEVPTDPNVIYGQGVTDIDGNEYATVMIGEQEWMAENLRVTRDHAGNSIARVCYGNDSINCDLYGGLYTWSTLMNGQSSSDFNPSGVQGICPDGWHVPSHTEWFQLIDYLESQGYPNEWGEPNGAGNALKTCRQVNSPWGSACSTYGHPRWNSHAEHHGLNKFGFSALPGGFVNTDGTFSYRGNFGYWWTSTAYSSAEFWLRAIYSFDGVVVGSYNTDIGLSLRCLRD